MSRDMRPQDPTAETPSRLWTVAEANARLATLEPLLDQLREWATRLHDVHAELRRLTAFWGSEIDAPDHADHHLKERLEAEWKNLSRRLDESIEALRAEAIEVKDLREGLVDFYTIADDALAYLCWRRGEPAVAFYHTLEGGFRTRRPVAAPERPSPASTRPT
jgi:hypothetical protein